MMTAATMPSTSPEREIVTFRGLPGRRVRARIVEVDGFFQERIGLGGDDRDLLGDGLARLSAEFGRCSGATTR